MRKVFLTGVWSQHSLKGNDVITRLDVGDALAYRLHDTSTLVTKDDGEGTLRVLARQSVCICEIVQLQSPAASIPEMFVPV